MLLIKNVTKNYENLRYNLLAQPDTKRLSCRLRKILTKEEGYPTPKVDVRGLIKRESFLLVEDLRTKEWSLPGGYAEIGCSPKENIEKEVLEETGLVVTAKELLAVYDTDKRKDIPQLFQYYKMIFSCDILENHPFEKH